MNYQKIHDALIDRARNRVYDSTIHHNHHIVPRHEDGESTETVPLTLKEHALIHHLRWRLTHTLGNRLAYLLLSNCNDPEIARINAILGGTKGGKSTKERLKGIFDPSWDRSVETKRRHEEGIITNIPLKGNSERASELGKLSVQSKKGIHSDNYDYSASSKQMWKSLSTSERNKRIEEAKNNAAKATKASVEKKANFISWDKNKHSEVARMGGKLPWWTNGIVEKKSNVCPGDGFVRGRVKRKSNVEVA